MDTAESILIPRDEYARLVGTAQHIDESPKLGLTTETILSSLPKKHCKPAERLLTFMIHSGIINRCESHRDWPRWIQSINSSDEWLLMANQLFNDGIIHDGRIKVLHYFTQCVIKQLGECSESDDIRKTYIAFRRDILLNSIKDEDMVGKHSL